MVDEKDLEIVEKIVNNRNGIKATELAALSDVRDVKDLVQTIECLVQNGRIVEVEYVLPNISYRIKSFLLPKGTQIQTRTGK